jgi:hypothetical protein
MLKSRQLYDVLAGIRCRKLIILDTCRSGDVASNPVRDLTRDGVPLLIFSSCERSQESLEPKPKFGKHGLFTQSLLLALKESAGKGKLRTKAVTARELAASIRDTLPKLLKELDQDVNVQTPVFYPSRESRDFGLAVLCRP